MFSVVTILYHILRWMSMKLFWTYYYIFPINISRISAFFQYMQIRYHNLYNREGYITSKYMERSVWVQNFYIDYWFDLSFDVPHRTQVPLHPDWLYNNNLSYWNPLYNRVCLSSDAARVYNRYKRTDFVCSDSGTDMTNSSNWLCFLFPGRIRRRSNRLSLF